MYADPTVVRRKVEREIAAYFERQEHFRSRGIWVLQYEFPQLLVAFVAAKVKPFPLAPYGVLLDLSNYDVAPPSVRFVNPFTKQSLKRSDIPTRLSRLRVGPNGQQQVMLPDGALGVIPIPGAVSQQDDLLQAWSDDDLPFVCLQGVLEYHQNPGHSGDSWWLHRGKGAGSILRLLDILARYGTESMRQLNVQLRIDFAGVQAELLQEQA